MIKTALLFFSFSLAAAGHPALHLKECCPVIVDIMLNLHRKLETFTPMMNGSNAISLRPP
jgi:hypothetical protein